MISNASGSHDNLESDLLGGLLLDDGTLSAHFLVVVEGSLELVDQDFHLLLVLTGHVGDSRSSASLLSDELTELGLGLDDAVSDVFLAAESRHPADQLNWVNVVSDDDELGLLLFDQFSDVVDTELENVGADGVGLLATSHSFQ